MTFAVLVGEKFGQMGLKEAFNDGASSAVGASFNWLALLSLTGALVVLTSSAFRWKPSLFHDYVLTNAVASVPDSIDERLLWCHEQRWPPPRPYSL